MGPSKLQTPNAAKAETFSQIVIHARVLVIAHVVALLGTGFAALAMAPAPFFTRRMIIGRSTWTLIKVLWVGWPFLASLGVSRSRLPGKTRAVGLFLVLLVAVAVVGGILLDAPLSKGVWGWDVVEIAGAETLVLTVMAEMLATSKWAGRTNTSATD